MAKFYYRLNIPSRNSQNNISHISPLSHVRDDSSDEEGTWWYGDIWLHCTVVVEVYTERCTGPTQAEAEMEAGLCRTGHIPPVILTLPPSKQQTQT